jgi:hypothetical protein
MQKFSVFVLFVVFLVNVLTAFGQTEQGNPTFVVVEQAKPENCPGGGLHLKEGYVKATDNNSFVDVDVFLQKYDGTWVKKNYTRKGSGKVIMNELSCDYTGNFYSYAYYSKSTTKRPTVNDVVKKHEEMGTNPKFRMTKKTQPPSCGEGLGIHFEEGEVFTPKGERIVLTLFMEKKDGSWRKKDFRYVGSGYLKLDILDCTLTGNFKTKIVFDK